MRNSMAIGTKALKIFESCSVPSKHAGNLEICVMDLDGGLSGAPFIKSNEVLLAQLTKKLSMLGAEVRLLRLGKTAGPFPS
jgi:hypothetical protein